MNVDKAKFLQEVNDFVASKSYVLFEKEYRIDLLKYTEHITIKPDIFDFAEIIPAYDKTEGGYDRYIWLLKIMMLSRFALKSTIGPIPQSRIVEGDFEVEYSDEHLEIIFGDLTVNGNFTNKGRLLVVGNMHVKGNWIDTYYHISSAAIGADLIVSGTTLTEGGLFIGGKLETQLAYLSYNQGFITVMEGCFSKILIEFDHLSSVIFGEIQTQYYDHDSLRTEASIKSNAKELMKDAPALFTNEFIEDWNKAICEDEEEYYDEDDEANGRWENFRNVLYEYMEKGKLLLQTN